MGAGVLLSLTLFAACSPTGGSTDDAGGPADGEVRFLIAENFWADWTPYASTAQSQHRLNRQIYDTLMDFPTGRLDAPEPMLATSWEQVDERTWEFELREDVTFHDGQEFGPDDVKASFEWASGATGEESILVDRWVPTQVEVVDENTVRLVTETPLASIFDAIRQTPIIAAEDVAAGADAMASEPNGTGPFKLEKETPTKKTMVANQDYWRDPAAIDTLVWEYVGDAQTRVNALKAGQADVIDRVPAEHHESLASTDGIAVESMTAAEQVNLWSIPGRVAAWDENPDLRRAIMLAIDRASLTENLVQGESRPAMSHMPSETLYYVENRPSYEQDVEEASRLVKESGAEGLEFEVWAAPGFLPAADKVGQAIVAMLEKVGLKPKLVTADVAGLVDDSTKKNGTGLLYHISWASGGEPASAVGIYTSANRWHLADPTVDELVAEGKRTVDPAQREGVYAELQARLWETLPSLPLYYSDFTVARSERVEGLQILPNYDTYFYPATLGE